jgi:hypothetical protein
MVISNISCDLPFSKNQPLKSDEDWYIRSVEKIKSLDFLDGNKKKLDLWFN